MKLSMHFFVAFVLAIGLLSSCSKDDDNGENEKKDEEKPIEVKTFMANGVSFEMVKVNEGSFKMGASENELTPDYYAKPAHKVILSDYMIGKTEVTQELWQAVMGTNPSNFQGNPQCPVECVSWSDCQEFLKKLSILTNESFRLPTEAEWEFAARGGNKSRGYLYAGSNTLSKVGWYWQNSGDVFLEGTEKDYYSFDQTMEKNNCKPHAVGLLKPNEIGIYDMSGNVSEWCQDWSYAYSTDIQTNPKGPESGTKRIYRGGNALEPTRDCQVSTRRSEYSDMFGPNCGLRLAL